MRNELLLNAETFTTGDLLATLFVVLLCIFFYIVFVYRRK